MSETNDLSQSVKSMGILVPVIKNKRTGNIVDGNHRLDIEPNAPIYEIDINESMEPLARLAINNVRRNADADEEEWTEILKLPEMKELKPEEIAAKTGIDVRTVYRHKERTPHGEAVSAGMKSAILRNELTPVSPSITIQETNPNLLVCEYCGVATSDCKPWNGHILCEKHFNRPEIDGYFRTKQLESTIKTKEPPLNRVTQSWADREARMHPQHSKIELDVLTLLEQEPELRPVAVDRGFPLVTTIPDFLFTKLNLAVYLDGPPHEGKEDRDEKLREMLTKRYGVRVVSIKTEGLTAKAIVARIKEEA